jgi:hypothetical protein
LKGDVLETSSWQPSIEERGSFERTVADVGIGHVHAVETRPVEATGYMRCGKISAGEVTVFEPTRDRGGGEVGASEVTFLEPRAGEQLTAKILMTEITSAGVIAG